MQQVATTWHCGESVVSLEIPILVGILNATPDSFSDGGAYLEVDAAVKHALEMVEAGATIIDVGGESTRPGAMRVDEEEQIARVVPVIQAIQNACNAIISIDTTRSSPLTQHDYRLPAQRSTWVLRLSTMCRLELKTLRFLL